MRMHVLGNPALNLALAALAVVFSSACDETFISIDSSSGRIEIRLADVDTDDRTVVVENHRRDTVFYFLVERDTDAVINWITCTDPDPAICRQLAPRATKRFPFDSIFGYRPGDRWANFHWWTRADRDVRTVRLDLQ